MQNNNKLNLEVRRYFIIAIKKLMTIKNNKEKLVLIEKEQNSIRNEINNLKTDGLEYTRKVEELKNRFQELELKKPIINWDQLVYKCIEQMIKRYSDIKREDITKIVEANKKVFLEHNYTLESFRLHNNINRRKAYKKMKNEKGEEVMTTKERADKIAAIKRERSLNVIFEVLDILKDKNMKPTSNNVYEVIKTSFNDCLKIRQIKTYLKQIKDSNNGL